GAVAADPARVELPVEQRPAGPLRARGGRHRGRDPGGLAGRLGRAVPRRAGRPPRDRPQGRGGACEMSTPQPPAPSRRARVLVLGGLALAVVAVVAAVRLRDRGPKAPDLPAPDLTHADPAVRELIA